jgi:hypothetical protein
MRFSLPLVVLLFLVFSFSFAVAVPSLNERLAQTWALESARCLSRPATRFLNATLAVLAAVDDESSILPPLNATVYEQLLGRFMSHVTQSMASGLPFCAAFARACGGLVGEWTRQRLPLPEAEYAQHCENVMRATDEADEYLYKGPAFQNRLYKCLRVAMSIPPTV